MTVPTAPPTTADPYAVPPVIDAAYVNRVLAAFDAAVGDVVRMVVSAKAVTPEAMEKLKALYAGEALSLQVDGFQTEWAQGFRGYKPVIGNQKTSVTELITNNHRCVFARVARDYSEVGEFPDPGLSDQYVALKLLEPSSDPNHYNPTPWIMTYDGFTKSRSRPLDPCASIS